MPSKQDSAKLQEVDSIIQARWLVPMTDKGLVLENHSLIVQHNMIREILPNDEALNYFQSKNIYKLDQHIVIPGLINSHGHAAMSLLRGFADDMPLKAWLEEKIWPAEGLWVNEKFVSDGAELAIAEMLLSGTTTFTDMYFFPDHVAKAAVKNNIRAHLASPVLDFPTVWAQNAEEYIHKAMELHDNYKNNEHVYVGFGPHAPYTVSDEPLRKIATLASELDIVIHMHVHETAHEVEESLSKDGRRPLARLHDLGLLIPNLQCVHMTQLTDEEIALLADTGASVVHCPASNLKLASGSCPVTRLLNKDINVALGTDGCASNNELNMLNEMRLAALMGKGVADDAGSSTAWDVLSMATINGARQMGLGDQIGTLESGKFADITAVNLNQINSMPVYNAVASLVYSAQASQVSHVWVGGQLNVENGDLCNMNQDALIAKAQQWSDKIQTA
jgi:5-methylthioadenosine/S-adenosylhomocysteine deaminase